MAAMMLVSLTACHRNTASSPTQQTTETATARRQGTSDAAGQPAPREEGRAACEALHADGPLEQTIAAITTPDSTAPNSTAPNSTAPNSTESERRLTTLMMCSLHGYGDHHIDAGALYPHIGALRPQLLAMMDQPHWQSRERRGVSFADHTRRLLSLWHHQDDTAHIEQWLAARKRFARRPSKALEGPTASAAALSWSDAHFEREMASSGMKTPPPFSLNLIESPSGDRALADHSVHYANWGYAHRLVLVRDDGGTWSVKITIETQHWHM